MAAVWHFVSFLWMDAGCHLVSFSCVHRELCVLPDRFYAVGCFGGVSLCDAGRGLLAAAAVGAAGGGCLACCCLYIWASGGLTTVACGG